MRIAIWFIAAIVSYLAGGINPAILLSKLIYKEDIRTKGSGNPGFTNFKRVYGNRYAWFVFILDILKGVVLSLGFGYLFAYFGYDRQMGAAFSGLFVMLGHSYPIQYHFQGGKGFLVLLALAFILDWKAGLIAAGVMVLLVLTLKYMSLATMCGLLAGTIALYFFGCDFIALILYGVCVLFMIYRHAANIKRLIAGTESKIYFFKKKEK